MLRFKNFTFARSTVILCYSLVWFYKDHWRPIHSHSVTFAWSLFPPKNRRIPPPLLNDCLRSYCRTSYNLSPSNGCCPATKQSVSGSLKPIFQVTHQLLPLFQKRQLPVPVIDPGDHHGTLKNGYLSNCILACADIWKNCSAIQQSDKCNTVDGKVKCAMTCGYCTATTQKPSTASSSALSILLVILCMTVIRK